MNDEQLLAAIPDHVSFETLLKARPVSEGGPLSEIWRPGH